MNKLSITNLYSNLLEHGVDVTGYNSDLMIITIKNTTSNEVLMLKNVLNSTGYRVTIELISSLVYAIHIGV